MHGKVNYYVFASVTECNIIFLAFLEKWSNTEMYSKSALQIANMGKEIMVSLWPEECKDIPKELKTYENFIAWCRSLNSKEEK